MVRRALWIAIAVGLVGAMVWLLRPRPLAVDTARVTRGTLTATVSAEGRMRVKDLYVVAAPVDGQLMRLTLEPGDAVDAGAIVARVQPITPRPLDARTRAEAEAAAAAARAAVERAEASAREAEVAVEHAESELARERELVRKGTMGAVSAEHAGHESQRRQRALDAARAAVRAARAELARATAAAAVTSGAGGPAIDVTSPIQGRVLRVLRESAGPIAAGTPLVEVGDPAELEVSAELLSGDAASVRAGAVGAISRWGEGQPLAARVRRVDPAAYTKVSALGLEEQRVRVVLDLVEPPPEGLGHDYRVDVSITTWSGAGVLRVPSTALFRSGHRWMVFAIRDGRARSTAVDVGPSDGTWSVVERGLAEGDRVVVQPSDELREGMRVR